jgi:hypothetical protein
MALMAENTDIDWVYQNKLREQWLLDNPDAQYSGCNLYGENHR